MFLIITSLRAGNLGISLPPGLIFPNSIQKNNPITYFLNFKRFEGYQFKENVWIPDKIQIQDYMAQQPQRKTSKVVYTCIINDYDVLIQPYSIDFEWDYVCFTDSATLLTKGRIGIWQIRKIQKEDLDDTRRNRWHKIHPHLLFPDYSESIYLDGNINIISKYLYQKAHLSKTPILLPRHFIRSCTYDEIKVLQETDRITDENKNLLKRQAKIFEASRFPKNYGLSENNVIYRKHHIDIVQRVMDQWWTMLCNFSSRDQASLAYVLWKNDISLDDITMPNIRVNYKDFWIVRHQGEDIDKHHLEVDNPLEPAFKGNASAIVMSCNQKFVNYLGVVLNSIVMNAVSEKTYDIIILESDIEDDTKFHLLEAFSDHQNISIRFYNMRSVLSQLEGLCLHIDGYVPLETYNKIFLADITEGYRRIAYVDTDIIVNTDINDLCEVELWGKSLGASANVANIHAAHVNKEIKGRNFREYLAVQLGIDDYSKYFQAGVIVLDMTSNRVKNLFSLSIDKIKSVKEPIFYDQCIFNSIFYGDVSYFSVEWNHVWYLQSYSYLRNTVSERVFFDYARSRICPKIVHFASGDKPTNKSGWDLSEFFWHYAKTSPYYSEILKSTVPKVMAEIKPDSTGINQKRLRLPRVQILLHIFYLDQIDFMINALKKVNNCEMKLCITASNNFDQVVEKMSPNLPNCNFIKVENVGYDVFPFLRGLQESKLSNFDYIIKLHTKNKRLENRNKVYGIDVSGYTWRDDLVNAILGSKEIFSHNLNFMENNPTVGSIGSGKYLFSTLENQEEENYNLAEWRAAFDIEKSNHYFGGTMFMARAYPFERFKRVRLEANYFKSADKLTSGSHTDKAHVFERLFGLVVESEGFTLQGV